MEADRVKKMKFLNTPSAASSEAFIVHTIAPRNLTIVYSMVLILDQNMLRKKIGFDDSLYVTECLQQIEIPDLFNMCGPCTRVYELILALLFRVSI